MKQPTCPRCGSFKLLALADGNYRCTSCGYTGSLGIEKGFMKW